MFPRSVPYEYNPPRRDNILTVAVPGVTSSRAQLSRYTGPEDGVFVLQNWADGFQPLVEEDGERNVNRRKSCFAVVKHAIWLLFHLRDDEKTRRASDAADGNADGSGSEGTRRGQAEKRESSDLYSPPSASPRVASAPSLPPLRWSTVTGTQTQRSDLPFPSPLPTPPVQCCARCRIGCRLLHNVLPSPEMAEIVHKRWWSSLNPVHWLLVMKEIATCLWFSVRPIQLCYSEMGRTNLGGTTDQLLFMREIQRAVELVQGEEKRHKAQTTLPAEQRRQVGGEDRTGEQSEAEKEDVEPTATAEGDDEARASPIPRPYVRPHLVLFGCSRGASTCFYTAMKIPRCLARYVSLVILEAPFDTLRNVIDSSSVFPSLSLWLFKAFCDHTGIENEREAYSFDPERVQIRCPVAFVLSTRDTRVPNSVTQVLIDEVRETLVPHTIPAVEVLTLTHSRHPCMAVGHKEDQAAYVAFVEGLYDTYCSGEPAPLS